MKRFKLHNLDIDRVDLVDRGANQYADIVIHKGHDARAMIAKNMKQGYPEDTQLKNGPPPVKRTGIAPMPKDVDEKKKKKGAKGSAFPERNAAESSTSAGSPPVPVEKHSPGGTGHDQKNHGKKGSGGGRKKPLSSKAKAKYKQAFGAADKAMKAKMAEGLSERDAQSSVIGHLRRNESPPGVGKVDRVGGFGDDDIDQAQFEQDALPEQKPKKRSNDGGATRHGQAPGDMTVRTDSRFDESAKELKATKIPDSYKNKYSSSDPSLRRPTKAEIDRVKAQFPNDSRREIMEEAEERIARSNRNVKKHTPGGQSHNQQNHAGGGGASGPPIGLTDGGGLNSSERRPLHSIAREIRADWSTKGKGVNFAAKPYLDAMSQMDSIHEPFFYDSGSSVVAYFLSNAGSWRGDTARKVKAELNEMLKDRPPVGAMRPLRSADQQGVKEKAKSRAKERAKKPDVFERNRRRANNTPLARWLDSLDKRFEKAFPPKKDVPPEGAPPQKAAPPQSGKELPKLNDVLGKPTDTKAAVPPGTPAPGKPEAKPTAPGQADPSQTPTDGALAPDELVPDSPPDIKGGPPLGPGTPGGQRPVETPKAKPEASGLPAAKPGVSPPPSGKKERIATDIKEKRKPPSGKPFA